MPDSTERRYAGCVTLHTFGDSILDCGRYNAYGVHPGQLIVQNDNELFPAFRGRDLSSRGPARLDHRAIAARACGRSSRRSAVDLHAHFLGGDPSWFTLTIEPSLIGASEVRRAFLAAL